MQTNLYKQLIGALLLPILDEREAFFFFFSNYELLLESNLSLKRGLGEVGKKRKKIKRTSLPKGALKMRQDSYLCAFKIILLSGAQQC